jgi:haloalkane dehalogenase
MSDISPVMKYTKKTETVLGKKMTYVEAGEGDPILFLHGNPTSSYLWRNIMPHVEDLGRCIAPDLIGMGDSEKLDASLGPCRYSFQVHYEYLWALMEKLDATENVTLVIHDWGSGMGFHWANLHREAVKGICYMEGFVTPLTWDDWHPDFTQLFQDLRAEKGEDLILNQNVFVDFVLPNAIDRDLTEEEMAHYRKPFLKSEDRQPTLNWPRAIPLGGQPVDVVAIVRAYSKWLEKSTDLPKLFVNVEPGGIITGRVREFCRTFPNQTEITVGPSIHFVQEDFPHEIGGALQDFIKKINGKKS